MSTPNDLELLVIAISSDELVELLNEEVTVDSVKQIIISGPRSLDERNVAALVDFLEQNPTVTHLNVSCSLNQGAAKLLADFFIYSSCCHVTSIEWNLMCTIDTAVLQCLADALSPAKTSRRNSTRSLKDNENENESVNELSFSYFAFDEEDSTNTNTMQANLRSINHLFYGRQNYLQSVAFSLCSVSNDNIGLLTEALSQLEVLERFAWIGGKPNDQGSAAILRTLSPNEKRRQTQLKQLFFDNPTMGWHSWRTIISWLCCKHCQLTVLTLPQHLFVSHIDCNNSTNDNIADGVDVQRTTLAALKLSNQSLKQFFLTFTCRVPSQQNKYNTTDMSNEEKARFEFLLNQYGKRNQAIAKVRDMLWLRQKQRRRLSLTVLAEVLGELAHMSPVDGASAMFLILKESGCIEGNVENYE